MSVELLRNNQHTIYKIIWHDNFEMYNKSELFACLYDEQEFKMYLHACDELTYGHSILGVSPPVSGRLLITLSLMHYKWW